MSRYFQKYKDVKLALFYMAGQCYSTYITLEAADKLGINYKNSDITVNNEVEIYTHGYEPIGQKVWHILKLDSATVTFSEFWKTDITEKEEKDKDYQKDYLELCLVLLKIAPTCYSYSITEEAASKMHVNYTDSDIVDGKIEVYDHFFETAGEKTWKVLNIPSAKVPAVVFKEKEQEIKKKLLELK